MLTMPEAVKTCFTKYVDFSGRAKRPEYWWFVLFLFIGNVFCGLLDGMIFGGPEMPPGGDIGEEVAGAALFQPVFALATFLPQLAAGVRRLHDRDMTGWWLLLLLVPAVGALVLLVMLALPGTKGDNRFGPEPAA